MRHDVALEGAAFRLRPVVTADAGGIVALRRDPARSRFLHATDASVAAQERWLEAYLERPDDYYWAVERLADGTVEGYVGVYDVDGDRAEWGRWVLRPGSLAGPESAWLVHEAAFGPLGLRTVLTRTLAGNEPVLAFHRRYGAEVLRTVPRYATIDGVVHDAVEARMTRAHWLSSAGPVLRAAAERAAGLVHRARLR